MKAEIRQVRPYFSNNLNEFKRTSQMTAAQILKGESCYLTIG